MALMDAFKKKMGKGSSKEGSKPKFADDGPPDMATAEPRGGGGGADDAGDGDVYASDMVGHGGQDNESADAGDSGGQYGDMEDAAADDIGDLAGVSPEDRENFKAALSTYVNACVAKALSEQDTAGADASPMEGDSAEE